MAFSCKLTKRLISLFVVFILAIGCVSPAFAAYPENQYRDVIGTRYENSVRKLYEWGVMNGYGDGTFRPYSYMTNAEAITAIERAFGNKDNLPTVWNDWFKEYAPDYKGTLHHYNYETIRNFRKYASINSAAYFILCINNLEVLPMEAYGVENNKFI